MIHHSTHDEFMSDKKVQYVDTRSRLLANTQEFRNFRFEFDWKMTDAWLVAQPDNVRAGLKTKIDYMKKVLLTVNKYFASRFQVKSTPTVTFPANTSCHGATPDPKYLGKAVEQDLLIVLKPHNERTSWFAAAGACLADSTTGRPVMGAVYLNFYHIHPSEVNEYYLPGVFIHELMHVLGFSGHFMEKMGLLRNIKHGNSTRTAVVSAGVVKHARDYFNCQELEGVPVENGGGGGSAGSHWEKTIFPAEVMNPQVSSPMKISLLTVRLLEDLGWYKGMNAHENYTYLKGDGCHTIKGGECNSTKSDEFCSSEDWGKDHCYPNKLGKGSCGRSSTFMGSCGLVMPSFNALCTVENNGNRKNFNFESYGAHSRCVMADKGQNNYNAACLRMRCTADKVEIQFGDEVHTCAGSGPQKVTTKSYTGTVKCPAFSEMCTEVLDKRCPMDCYGQGYCMANGTCQCLGGFTGDDCNKGLPKEQDPFVTDYDIRNNGKKDEEEEPKKKEEKEKKEEEEERKDEEEEREDDEDEEKEDEENEEDEEKEEKQTPFSEASKLLMKQIATLRQYANQWTFSLAAHNYKTSQYALCAEGESAWNKRCEVRMQRQEANAKRAQSYLSRYNDSIESKRAELWGGLNDDQKERVEFEREAQSADLQKELDDKLISYYEKHKSDAEKRAERWGAITDKYGKYIARYEGKSWAADWVKRMLTYVEKFNAYKNYYLQIIEMTEKLIEEIQERQGEMPGFDDVATANIEAEIAAEMDLESANANGNSSGNSDGNGEGLQIQTQTQN